MFDDLQQQIKVALLIVFELFILFLVKAIEQKSFRSV